ncbi:MAG: ArgE/DapE family deacylase [Geodermatophilaceae bacterium]
MSDWLDAEARVLDAVDECWTIDRLRDLVAIPSVTGSDAESAAQHYVAGWLTDLGLDVDLWPIDLVALSVDPQWPGQEAARRQAWGLVGSIGGDGPSLALSGHIDVVPAGDLAQWTSDPFEPTIRDDAVVGRGACDMKGGLVAAVAAVAAIVRSGVPLAGRLAVHSVVSEEDGGLGALATIRRGHVADACVIPEPTDGAVLTASAGALGFRLTVPGRSAHGARRTEGISAFEAFLPVHRALLELERSRNAEPDPRFAGLVVPYALSIGKVSAGDWASTVPDLLVAEGRYGVQLGEPVSAARAVFEACVAAACARDPWLADHPVRIEWAGGQYASGTLPAGHRLLADVQAAVEDVTGAVPPERAGPYGSDLRHYAAAGVPTVHYGPGDLRWAHAPDERVPIADVVSTARVLALLALRTCGAR